MSAADGTTEGEGVKDDVKGPEPPTPAFKPATPHPGARGDEERGGTVLFEIRFNSTLGATDLELLRRQLGMASHVDHKLPVDPNGPAVARLDGHSGLFLDRGGDGDGWLLQARTWGHPPKRTVHAWQVQAATVAAQLDPTVTLPERLAPARPEPVGYPVGEAANGRLSHLRRRLVGLR